jgi:Domain of unknown function (DUF4352)
MSTSQTPDQRRKATVKVIYELVTLALMIMGLVWFYQNVYKPSHASSSSPSASTPTPGIVSVRTPFSLAGFQISVEGSRCGVTIVGSDANGGTYSAPTQMCEVALRATNTSNGPLTFYSQDDVAYDASGRKFAWDLRADIYGNEGAALSSPDTFNGLTVNPGNSVAGHVYFDVPAGTTITEVDIQELDSNYNNVTQQVTLAP